MVVQSRIIHLYIKTHNITGLSYLGKTVRDPETYRGSGKRWKNHLAKHGNDVATEILFSSSDEEEFVFVASVVSYMLDVVDSEDFANIVHEEGSGGNTFEGRKHTEETIALMKKRALERPPLSEESRMKMSKTKTGVKIGPNKTPRTDKHRENLSKSLKGKDAWNKGKKFKRTLKYLKCVHCGKEGLDANIKRWHNDNCPTVKPKEEYRYVEITCDCCGVVSRKCPYFYKVHNERCKNVGVRIPKDIRDVTHP